MAITYDDVQGDTWRVYLGEDPPHEGVLPLIFHCTTNPSNGWRVVEVPESEYSGDRVDGLKEPELEELFARAQPFDFVHDEKAKENVVGDTDPR